jgi:hypothetical protein
MLMMMMMMMLTPWWWCYGLVVVKKSPRITAMCHPMTDRLCWLQQGTLDSLLANKDQLADILKYHVVKLFVKVRQGIVCGCC